MKIVVIGGAGRMGRITVRDLNECPEVEKILIADYQEEKAKRYAASFNSSRIEGCFIDAYNINETSKIIKNYDAVINAAHYRTNLHVMHACLEANCHYNDLGGLFHMTLKQLKLFDEFKKSKLTAILGIGSAPGITNLLAAYACDRLNMIETIKLYCATANLTDMKGIDVFMPPYSIITIMEEFSEDTIQFIDGEYKTLPALSGSEEIVFPEPIGKQICYHTLHSEPATLPLYYKDKGIKEVSWRLGFPSLFTERAKFLANIGFSSKEPIKIKNIEVSPIDVLDSVIEKQIKEKLRGVILEHRISVCLRAYVKGMQNKKPVEYTVDCLAGIHSRWKTFCATSVPPSIAAQMQVNGMIKEPGVWGPEKVIDTDYFFKELTKREMTFQISKKETIS